MRKIIFFAFSLVFVLTVKGQQKMSYAYDAAGNRISRTIVVGANNPDMKTPETYMDFIENRQLTVSIDNQQQLTVSVNEYNSLLNGGYSIFDKDGSLVTKKGLSGAVTVVELENLLPGKYLFQIFLNEHPTEWELIKL